MSHYADWQPSLVGEPADLNYPIDPVHEEAVVFQGEIRMLFQEARERAATWEPRPMPEDWQ